MSLLDTASLVVTPNGTKAGKLYSVVPSSGAGDLDVTRATTATRVNSSGLIESVASNVPRLDYTNGSCPSILVEPQRTNLVLRSQEFENGYWNKANATITPNAVASPDGTTTADKFIEDSTNNVHVISFPSSTTPSGTNTLTLYAKQGERNWICLYLFDSVDGSIFAWFNVANGTIGTVNSGLTAKIEPFENGFYKCSITRTQSNVGNGGFILSNSDNSLSYTGNGTSGLFIWGAQLEAGSYATSYIPTTTASVTRNADVISKTGISSLIGQTEGTVYWEASNLFTSGTRSIALLYTSGSSFYQIYLNSSNQVRADVNGSFIFAGGTILGNTNYKIAFAYKSGNYALYINGVQIATSTSTTMPSSLNDLYLANSTGGEQSGAYKVSALWKTRLTNTQLAQLTTI
jgi:hypothetical protein